MLQGISPPLILASSWYLVSVCRIFSLELGEISVWFYMHFSNSSRAWMSSACVCYNLIFFFGKISAHVLCLFNRVGCFARIEFESCLSPPLLCSTQRFGCPRLAGCFLCCLMCFICWFWLWLPVLWVSSLRSPCLRLCLTEWSLCFSAVMWWCVRAAVSPGSL